jgi:hypothetical protein
MRLIHRVDFAPDADNGVQPQQFDGHGGVGEINLAGAKRGDGPPRQRLDIDLEAYCERGRRSNSGDDFVHPEHVGPQLLVAESVETEDGLPTSFGVVPRLTSNCAGRGDKDRVQRLGSR